MSPSIRLNNGVEIPAMGLGVFLSPPEVTADVVETAITLGYRLVDTAAAYFNETEVGEGIRRSGIDRSELFVTTKAWPSDYGSDDTRLACHASLKRLGLDYVDMYMLHWPVPESFDKTVEAFQAAVKLMEEGNVRAVGVSNFTPAQLDELIRRTDVVPAVNQVELHPYFTQREVAEAGAQHGVLTQAWSPIGGAYGRRPQDALGSVFQDATLAEIGSKYSRSAAQVVLRWHLDHDRSAIPKSVHADRIAENFHVFDFTLNAEELAAIDALDTGVRGGKSHPDSFTMERAAASFQIPR
jgi:diketogulonate reductase-like aldo/keto reductase